MLRGRVVDYSHHYNDVIQEISSQLDVFFSNSRLDRDGHASLFLTRLVESLCPQSLPGFLSLCRGMYSPSVHVIILVLNRLFVAVQQRDPTFCGRKLVDYINWFLVSKDGCADQRVTRVALGSPYCGQVVQVGYVYSDTAQRRREPPSSSQSAEVAPVRPFLRLQEAGCSFAFGWVPPCLGEGFLPFDSLLYEWSRPSFIINPVDQEIISGVGDSSSMKERDHHQDVLTIGEEDAYPVSGIRAELSNGPGGAPGPDQCVDAELLYGCGDRGPLNLVPCSSSFCRS